MLCDRLPCDAHKGSEPWNDSRRYGLKSKSKSSGKFGL